MHVYVVRHGQTDWNLQNRVQGVADIPLNEEGRSQAIALCSTIRSLSIDFIFSSPLKRTIETAILLNQEKMVPLFLEERLKERDYGEFEGLNKKEFDLETFWDYDANIQYERAENIQDCVDRVYCFLKELEKNYMDKHILLVTHGGLVRIIDGYFHNQIGGKFISTGLDNGEIREYSIENS